MLELSARLRLLGQLHRPSLYQRLVVAAVWRHREGCRSRGVAGASTPILSQKKTPAFLTAALESARIGFAIALEALQCSGALGAARPCRSIVRLIEEERLCRPIETRIGSRRRIMRNWSSKSIVAGGAGDVDGRHFSSDPGVRTMAWRWLAFGLSTRLPARDSRFSPKPLCAKPHSRGQ
jgi:hypothetical protein